MHLEVVLRDLIPGDQSRQARLNEYLKSYLGSLVPGTRVLDLGCGAGDLVRAISSSFPGVDCIGVDIADSPEVTARRARAGGVFVTYDGVRLPFRSDSIDAIVTRQVLEHVRKPDLVFSEVHRVLRSGGFFFGSTSQLEPYHSFSTWNYTPYGLIVLAEDCGLGAVEFRPGADLSVLILRRFFRRRGMIDKWLDRESPLNRLIGVVGRLGGWGHTRINAVKLMLAGQFYFCFRKP